MAVQEWVGLGIFLVLGLPLIIGAILSWDGDYGLEESE